MVASKLNKTLNEVACHEFPYPYVTPVEQGLWAKFWKYQDEMYEAELAKARHQRGKR